METTIAAIPWRDILPNTYRDGSGYCETRSPLVRRRPKPEAPPVVQKVEREPGEWLDVFGLCQHFGCRPEGAIRRVRALGWESKIDRVMGSDRSHFLNVQVWRVQA